MTGRPETPPQSLADSIEQIADQLCSTVDGDFNVRVATADDHPSVQKLALMVNFLLDNMRRSITAAESQNVELHTAKTRAEDADRAKTDFLSVVSHEFRTPLNGIFGGVNMLRAASAPDTAVATDIIDQSGRRLLTLIDGLLLYIRVTSEGPSGDVLPVKAVGLCEQVAALCGPGLQSCQVTLETVCDPALSLLLDEEVAAHALAGLVDNAARASAPGDTVRLSIDEQDDGVVITIADQGIGMDADLAARAASAFASATNNPSRSRDGLGLGLPLARGFAEFHDGELEIESRTGAGATVRIRLPGSRITRSRATQAA